MTDIPLDDKRGRPAPVSKKFSNPDFTLDGEPRAKIALLGLETLWINTGTLCNIECINCYIESSPRNDRLAYFSRRDALAVFDEIERLDLGTKLIGFTGGEPFMNPEMTDMARTALSRGFEVLILSNAMQPMQREAIKQALLKLNRQFGKRLKIRVSLDHFSQVLHETERGKGAWEAAIAGVDWLNANDFGFALAGRTCWNETEALSRAGYARLILERGYGLDAYDPADLLLLPEMDENLDVPEITSRCWDILNVNPADIMCATSRMVVKEKGAVEPSVMPCTLLPYDGAFHMGATLGEAQRANGHMFDAGAVKLNHHYCAKFCVLGGGSCTTGGTGG